MFRGVETIAEWQLASRSRLRAHGSPGMVRPMTLRRILFASLLATSIAACEKPSKLDSPVEVQARPSGSLEERVRRLEETLARREESLKFLEQAYAAQKKQMEAEEAREHAPDAVFAVDITENLKHGLVEGPANAPVTIVKAFDFACPYCQTVNTTLEELVKKYDGKVRVVYKNLVVHPDTAMAGHLASCAAAKQNKYVAFKNAFWEKAFTPYAQSGGKDRASLGTDNITKIAGELGLDTAKLKADMEGAECKGLIAADMAELEKFQVGSTPTLFVNGTHVGGALPAKVFEKLIDEKLALVEKSGVSGTEYYDKEVMAKGEKQFRSKKDTRTN
jgi:protein-disulfide isomerase